MTDNAYGDQVSQAEEDELKKLMASDSIPEPDDSQDQQVEPPPPDDDDDDAPAIDTPPADDGDDDGDDDGSDSDGGDDKYAAWLEKHKGKSPEELARIAFQQNQRASRAEFDGRQTAANLKAISERIQAARDSRLQEIEEKRAAFKAKVETDPDQALIDAQEAGLNAEAEEIRRRAEIEQFNADAEAAVQLASSAIPDFEKRAPEIRDFATSMGFTPEEVGRINDGRQIVTLHLASLAGRLIQGGIIDVSGKFLAAPQPVETPPAGGKPAAKRGFSRQPARGAQAGQTAEERLADIANMSDEDFAKIADNPEVMRLLEEADLG